MPSNVVLVPGSTQKVCQLTGEIDQQTKRLTLNQTETRFGLRGADLGASFEHEGRVYFLWGASHPTTETRWRPFDYPSVSFSQAIDGEQPVKVSWVTAPDGGYRAMTPASVSLGGFEVPTGGVSYNGLIYVFCTTQAQRIPEKGAVIGRSVLLRSRDNGATFHAVRTVSRDKFIYNSPVVVENPSKQRLPDVGGRGLLLFASGTEYRRSNPYLAYMPLGEIERPQTVRYFAGLDRAEQPRWSGQEQDAKALFDLPCVGENCVVFDHNLSQWLMLYNCEARRGPRGIHFRTAPNPWGPWSDLSLLFEPDRDRAFGQYMHRANAPDGLSEPGRDDQGGSEYGPYIVERFTRGKPGETTLYYVMSTWNPYNTVLMKSTLRLV